MHALVASVDRQTKLRHRPGGGHRTGAVWHGASPGDAARRNARRLSSTTTTANICCSSATPSPTCACRGAGVAAAYSLVQWQKLRRYEAPILRTADATIAVERGRSTRAARAGGRHAASPSSPTASTPRRTSHSRPCEPSSTHLVFTGKMDYRPNIDAVLWFAHEVLPLVAGAGARRPLPDCRHESASPGSTSCARSRTSRSPARWTTRARISTHAAVYVIPMRVGGGTRFKALEAMAMRGAPSSARRSASKGIGATDGQEMLLADTPDAFAAAVLRLLARPAGGRVVAPAFGRIRAALRRGNLFAGITSSHNWRACWPRPPGSQ